MTLPPEESGETEHFAILGLGYVYMLEGMTIPDDETMGRLVRHEGFGGSRGRDCPAHA